MAGRLSAAHLIEMNGGVGIFYCDWAGRSGLVDRVYELRSKEKHRVQVPVSVCPVPNLSLLLKGRSTDFHVNLY